MNHDKALAEEALTILKEARMSYAQLRIKAIELARAVLTLVEECVELDDRVRFNVATTQRLAAEVGDLNDENQRLRTALERAKAMLTPDRYFSANHDQYCLRARAQREVLAAILEALPQC